MKKKDQEAIASLYVESYRDANWDQGDYDENRGEIEYNRKNNPGKYENDMSNNHDLINSKEYQSVATIVDNLRKLDDRLIWNSIMDINTGDKNKILTALDELGVNPRFRANTGGAVFRDED
jgi:hypothetical protein